MSPGDSLSCVLCGLVKRHQLIFFLHCNVIEKVWFKVLRLIDFSLITPPNLFTHIAFWNEEEKKTK